MMHIKLTFYAIIYSLLHVNNVLQCMYNVLQCMYNVLQCTIVRVCHVLSCLLIFNFQHYSTNFPQTFNTFNTQMLKTQFNFQHYVENYSKTLPHNLLTIKHININNL